MRIGAIVLLFLLGALAAAPARAERIYLRDGDFIDGWILEERGDRLVVQVIQGTSVGKVTILQTEIDKIDRTRRESLDEALARARAKTPAGPAAPAPAPPPAAPPSATPAAPKAPQPAGGAPKKEEKKKTAAELIPKATPEQEAEIEASLAKLGGESHHKGRSGREEAALEALTAMGPVVLPYVTTALADPNAAKRMNAAKVITNVAHQEQHIEAYLETIPALLIILQDQGTEKSRYVRAAGAEALDAISGAGIAWPAVPDWMNELTPEEAAAAQKWQEWWAATKKKLGEKK